MTYNKKKIFTILPLCICLFFYGCQYSGEENTESNTLTFSDPVYNFDTDWQYYYRSNVAPMSVTCSDKGYYICTSDRGFVKYVDRQSLKQTPLCRKANCDHTDPETCDAFLTDWTDASPGGMSGRQSIQFYNGNLYFLTYQEDKMTMDIKAFLTRAEADGSEKKNIVEMKTDDWIIHRGYIYCFNDRSIYRISLDSPDEEEMLMEFERYYKGSNTVKNKFFYGDYLYFNYSVFTDETETQTEDHSEMFDLKTLEHKNIEYNGTCSTIKTVANGRLVFTLEPKGDEVRETHQSYSCEPDFTDIKEFAELKFGETIFCDSNYIYISNGNKIAIRNITGEKQQDGDSSENTDYCGQTIRIFDLEMNEVDTFLLPCEWPAMGVNACDPQNFLFFIPIESGTTSRSKLYVVDKSKIGTFHGDAAELIDVAK